MMALSTGTKVWITFEHNMTENNNHLVLAKVPGSPEGTRHFHVYCSKSKN